MNAEPQLYCAKQQGNGRELDADDRRSGLGAGGIGSVAFSDPLPVSPPFASMALISIGRPDLGLGSAIVVDADPATTFEESDESS